MHVYVFEIHLIDAIGWLVAAWAIGYAIAARQARKELDEIQAITKHAAQAGASSSAAGEGKKVFTNH